MSRNDVDTVERLAELAGYVPDGWHDVCLDAVAIIKRKANTIAKLESDLIRRASANAPPDNVVPIRSEGAKLA